MPERLFHILAIALLVTLTCAYTLAGAVSASEQASRVYVPAPPKGKGDNCVADTEFMRRNHMTVLNHQRDDTVHDGIRTKRFSLKECIACHAVNGPDARPVTIESPKHFCRECHDYAAVKMDCFECHASRPADGKAARSPSGAGDGNDGTSLAAYLKSRER